jgi:hypothetical protein
VSLSSVGVHLWKDTDVTNETGRGIGSDRANLGREMGGSIDTLEDKEQRHHGGSARQTGETGGARNTCITSGLRPPLRMGRNGSSSHCVPS